MWINKFGSKCLQFLLATCKIPHFLRFPHWKSPPHTMAALLISDTVKQSWMYDKSFHWFTVTIYFIHVLGLKWSNQAKAIGAHLIFICITQLLVFIAKNILTIHVYRLIRDSSLTFSMNYWPQGQSKARHLNQWFLRLFYTNWPVHILLCGQLINYVYIITDGAMLFLTFETDVGYAWVVLIACFFAHILNNGISSSLGIFIVPWQNHFVASVTQVTWIISLNIGLALIVGKDIYFICTLIYPVTV